MKEKAYVAIARIMVAIDNCKRAENADRWNDTIKAHTERINAIVREVCPNGSNVEQLTSLDMERSRPDSLWFVYPVHLMDPNGYWAGWRDYRIHVRPSLAFGRDVRVTGRDYNGNKEGIAQEWDSAMEATI